MKSEIIFLVEEAPEGGYIARALGESIFTEADTWEELKEQIQDAVKVHFEDHAKPSMIRLHLKK
ncbi:MAG: 2-oxoisovalerate dehydrogenase [Chloroflexi bacterium]|nr:2-oxoisovalerate dehydrogenase [Chloroflexota bacterium]